MSNQIHSAGGGPSDDKQSLSKFMRRASKVLKGSSSKTSSSPANTPESAPTTIPRTPQTIVMPPSPIPSVHQPMRAPKSIMTAPPTPKLDGSPSFTTAAAAYAAQEGKIRSLFAKYNLTLEPGDWTPVNHGDGQRVEKKIRMRVHRQCHRCEKTFGPERMCSNCQHTRCKKCPRFPIMGPMTQEMKDRAMASVGDGEKAVLPRAAIVLTIPRKAPGVKDLVRKLPAQRVRRTCHKCQTAFVGRGLDCAFCEHRRCAVCPRDPHKPEKYPNGYPGDQEETYPLAKRQLKSIRTRIRWTCHDCHTTFKAHEKRCMQCGHALCDSCIRDPPKRTRRPFNEEAVRGLEQRLGGLQVLL